MTSQLAAALRAAAAGIHPDEAAAGLIISHGTFLRREDFLCHVETAACIGDGTPMAWIDWDAVIAALDGGRLPASGREKRIVRIAASLGGSTMWITAEEMRQIHDEIWRILERYTVRVADPSLRPPDARAARVFFFTGVTSRR